MWSKLYRTIDFISNMGWRYIAFRLWHVFQIKSGIFKSKFPAQPEFKSFSTLHEWREAAIPFFIDGKESLPIKKELSRELAIRFRESVKNNITFFNSTKQQLDTENQWSVNPSNGFKYDVATHWSQIPDLSKEAGDIKFVWEKARFSYLHDILRYDYHSGEDQAAYVFKDIEDFIDKNPINLGPQYKCSQEISLRILNWTYALYFYKHSEVLTEALFAKIINAIYWQLHHVWHNIHFSRIAVRNNHAITETLLLYLSGLLFPFIPETKQWSKQGKKWFEKEIAYQIYEDGTFLQYSMNYHRVVIQLLTWGIRLSELHGDSLSKKVYEKAHKSLYFLDTCLDESSGMLPNYGSNDGALFFKFTDDDYRVYRSQLNDLRMVLKGEATHDAESFGWYGLKTPIIVKNETPEIASFDQGGYYVINEGEVKTFIRCGAYKDRPAQADNLHLDIWIAGVNYLWDCGSYKYNTEERYIKHFTGTAGHNTVTINNEDQMLKGGRFIWFYWVKKAMARLSLREDIVLFTGKIKAFRQLGVREHTRTVKKTKDDLEWTIKDSITLKKGELMKQHWHLNPSQEASINFEVTDIKGRKLVPERKESWYSSYYGSKEKSIQLTYTSSENEIHTRLIIAP